MAANTTASKVLTEKVEQLRQDIELTREFVHGDEQKLVMLGEIPTPSYRKLVHDFRHAADGHLMLTSAEANRAAGEADRAGSHALSAAEHAQRSSGHADRAEQAVSDAYRIVEEIPGFASSARSFFGLRAENLQLVVDRPGSGEVMRAADYEAVYILPSDSRLYLRDGDLHMELLFTQ